MYRNIANPIPGSYRTNNTIHTKRQGSLTPKEFRGLLYHWIVTLFSVFQKILDAAHAQKKNFLPRTRVQVISDRTSDESVSSTSENISSDDHPLALDFLDFPVSKIVGDFSSEIHHTERRARIRAWGISVPNLPLFRYR